MGGVARTSRRVAAACLGIAVVLAAAGPAVAQRAPSTERLVAPGELAAALGAARPGDTLRLQAGIHRGPLTVEVSVRLLGEPGAIIEGDGSGTVLTLAADGIEVSGLEVRGSGADLSTDDAVILLHDVQAAVVRDCRIEARGFGIYLRGGGRHRIADNVIRGDASLAPARRGNGIHLWHTEGNEVEGNDVDDVRDGIYLSFAHDNIIRGNEGHDLRYGIHYMYSERNALVGNRFSGSTGGIALMYSLDNRILDNVLTGNRDFGILCLQLERSAVEGNDASGNGRGIFLENSAGNRVVGNRMAGNGVGAYLTAGSEGNVLAGNRFAGNLVQVYEDRGGQNQWFEGGRGNFWSDYAGFDWDGDGVGETPYRLHTAASALMVRRPAVRWFWRSPVLALLDWWQGRVAAAPPGGLDPYPLVTLRPERTGSDR